MLDRQIINLYPTPLNPAVLATFRWQEHPVSSLRGYHGWKKNPSLSPPSLTENDKK
jgi:hypothetical protein